MYFQLSILVPLLASLTTALPPINPPKPEIGQALVVNNCPDPIYLWSVGNTSGPETCVQPNTTYHETYHEVKSGGVAIKITAVPDGLYNNKPQLILAYTLVENERRVYYDLSEYGGSPFKGKDVKLVAGREKVPVVEWKNGVQPGQYRVFVVDPKRDLRLSIC